MTVRSTVREPVRTPHEPLAYRVDEFCAAAGLGKTTVYSLIAEGKLASIKIGKRRLIPREAARALIEEASNGRS